MAQALARTEVRVGILDLKEETTEAMARAVRATGGEALAVAADVLDRASLQRAADMVQSHFGPCDILVNGAGGNHPKGTTTRDNLTLDDFLAADPKVMSLFDLNETSIRVNVIAPGFFVTNQNHGRLYKATGELTERSGKILAHTPMGRFGESGELIGPLLWLTSEEASGFVTGMVVPVDGGFPACSGL
jgi:NAD(P)-dependent dehydrogenase (short-subunit alcohol dehydrogenase family)